MRRYYDQRLEASRTNPAIVYAVYEVVRSREVGADEAADVVDEVTATLAGSSRIRHEADFPTGIHCIDQMLHAAYASSATTSALSIPIPSMATHIANLLSAEKRDSVRRVTRSLRR